jgi:hypothetical protein
MAYLSHAGPGPHTEMSGPPRPLISPSTTRYVTTIESQFTYGTFTNGFGTTGGDT